MMSFINDLLIGFKKGFSRERTFKWFVIIVMGLMIGGDGLGVTSILRSLMLDPAAYIPMLNFFRSDAWSLDSLMEMWWKTILKHAPIVKENDAVVLIGDGIKRNKEAKRMPGVKLLHQESSNSGKPSYIWGHMFGAIGILASNGKKAFSIPLALMLQDGIKIIFNWGGGIKRQGSHVQEMVNLVKKATNVFGKVVVLLDSYFLTVPALTRLNDYNKDPAKAVQVISKAKMNCVAHRAPPDRQKGCRGRPAKWGVAVKLRSLFDSEAGNFSTTKAVLYGKEEEVRYFSEVLIWGQKLYKQLRFVLTEIGGVRFILVSTDTTIDPVRIIELYSMRFRIEGMFREMSQTVSSFSYRFWSKMAPKLPKRRKEDDIDPMSRVKDSNAKDLIQKTVKAIEGFVFCSAVATGLLQMVSLKFSSTIDKSHLRYLRTYRNEIVSESSMSEYVRQRINQFIQLNADLAICKIIKEQQIKNLQDGYYEKVS